MSLEAPPPVMITEWRPVYVELAKRIVWSMQAAPAAYLTSWWRSADHNRSVGGHPYSQHLLGFAFDFVVNDRAAEQAFVKRVREAGLVPVLEFDHVHVQAFPAGLLPRNLFPGIPI